MRQRTIARAGLIALLGLPLVACGGEAVAGGQREAELRATGDGSGASPDRGPAMGGRANVAAAAVQGTVRFTGAARLVGSAGTLPVNGSRTVTVRADGRDTLLVVRALVPASAYARARVVFYDVDATVTGGLVIGGAPFTGQVEVAIAPGDSIVVERTVSIPAGNDPIEVLVDLNADAWLATANPVSRTVTAAAFQAAVQIQAR